jgi:hypothetical protein
MAFTSKQRRFGRRSQRVSKDDGIQSVRCRVCGNHLRVISGRHLSKHGIDREEYMEEYRLTPDELIAKDFRLLRSSRRDFVPHGRREWIAAIRKVYKRDRTIAARHLQRHYPHLYHQALWIFGGWDKALRAGGFDPDRMRIRRAWDEETIIAGIRRLRERELPLYAAYAMRRHAGLFKKALRQYGSWNKALAVAGIATVKAHFPSVRLVVLRALREHMETRSKNAVSPALILQAEYYFGSVRKAMSALGKDQRLLRSWSTARILKMLRRLHRAKAGLAYAEARRSVPALVSAAETYFGSWGRALYAAGIDPNLYFVHHRWRKAG